MSFFGGRVQVSFLWVRVCDEFSLEGKGGCGRAQKILSA